MTYPRIKIFFILTKISLICFSLYFIISQTNLTNFSTFKKEFFLSSQHNLKHKEIYSSFLCSPSLSPTFGHIKKTFNNPRCLFSNIGIQNDPRLLPKKKAGIKQPEQMTPNLSGKQKIIPIFSQNSLKLYFNNLFVVQDLLFLLLESTEFKDLIHLLRP